MVGAGPHLQAVIDTFSDKEQVWADNAASSRFFGNTYVCWASFRSNSHGNALPTPLMVSRSTDGGTRWTTRQVGPATDNGINSQPDGCTIRTDSTGDVYVHQFRIRETHQCPNDRRKGQKDRQHGQH